MPPDGHGGPLEALRVPLRRNPPPSFFFLPPSLSLFLSLSLFFFSSSALFSFISSSRFGTERRRVELYRWLVDLATGTGSADFAYMYIKGLLMSVSCAFISYKETYGKMVWIANISSKVHIFFLDAFTPSFYIVQLP